MTRTVRLALALLALAAGPLACNSHPITNFNAGPQIIPTGISVPVPPPSLTAAPVQRVDVEGQLNDMSPKPDITVFLQENKRGLPGAFVAPEDAGSFLVEGFEIDLTDNCIEVWAEDEDGESTVHSFFRARIDDDDQSVVTEPLYKGC